MSSINVGSNFDRAVEFNNYGIECFHVEDYLEAHRNFSRAIDLHPQFLSAYHNRACASMKLNANFIDPSFPHLPQVVKDLFNWNQLLHIRGVMFYDRFC